MLTLVIRELAVFALEEEVPESFFWDLESWIARFSRHLDNIFKLCYVGEVYKRDSKRAAGHRRVKHLFERARYHWSHDLGLC